MALPVMTQSLSRPIVLTTRPEERWYRGQAHAGDDIPRARQSTARAAPGVPRARRYPCG
jgi:hypothetical protein